ncbi:GNAT family N-acetyltransferase [Streptacidiphilus pinicola]|uniref:GNAT family N-acetyltransferase n=1 Tax=Streptacidiphilus pinicola TaxID=2219663 RepID=A0A2X0IPM8_9ACTN|nr:GNAT family N-acetyltransferase [Streptacidiphilus pinicola]RAG86607.1 GNAT family N-acetyltransferase [Streptacidiphilus pinicola]
MTTVQPEPIRTDRLTLLPLRVEHADEMAVVLADPGLHTFTGGVPETAEALRARYARWVAGSPDPAQSWCNWVVRLRGTDELTGTVQATITTDGGPGAGATAEVAWVVGTAWQGHGIATEAARGLVAWLRAHQVATVVAHIHPDHAASAAVAAAVGLTPTDQWQDGELRWERRPDGCAPDREGDQAEWSGDPD